MKEIQQQIEGNKLIAEFDGGVFDGRKYWKFPDGRIKIHAPGYDSQLKYHSSWDWLMPVVQRILALNVETFSSYQLWVSDSLAYADINKLWESVVDFIKWYNQNK